MNFYIPNFWLGFATGFVVCLIITIVLVNWVAASAKKKRMNKK